MVESKEHNVEDIGPGKGIEVVDPAGNPVEGLDFKVELPDGKTTEGTTKSDGIIVVPSTTDGDVKVQFVAKESEPADEATATGTESTQLTEETEKEAVEFEHEPSSPSLIGLDNEAVKPDHAALSD